jgi:hypothetical protein
MAHASFWLPDRERSIIWRYLDGVSLALAKRFERGSPPNEDNLSFLLCELLDENSTSLHVLDYPLSSVRDDLACSDGGVSLDVEFQTNEHSRHFEHHYSRADLGVIFVIDHPFFGKSKKAILLQAKRLFPNPIRIYTLNSRFESFDRKQLQELRALTRRFEVANSAFYLWYCPTAESFSAKYQEIIRSIEATVGNESHLVNAGWPFVKPRPEILLLRNDLGEQAQSWRACQPATRISDLDIVEKITSAKSQISLMDLYSQRLTWEPTTVAFEPFANLLMLGLISDWVGSRDEDWIRLAKGEMVLVRQQVESAEVDMREFEHEIAPKHSLTLTLRSSIDWPDDLSPLP